MTLPEALTVVATTIAIERSRGIRFGDLVDEVRRAHPDADVCEIDRAARPFATGEPGAYVYEADRQRVLPGMEE